MTASKPIRVIVADDEPIACELLVRFLEQESDFEVLAALGDGQSALESIIELQPDLVFLDIEMPELTGIDLVGQLPEPLPKIVFVTAYDQYAIQAFEENALDYLLKPFDEERFQKSLHRIRKSFSSRQQSSDTDHLMTALHQLVDQNQGDRYLKKINCKQRGKIRFIPVSEVMWIESEGAFCKLHLKQGMELTNLSIKRLEQLLDPETHLRIHKSFIVGFDYIESIEPYFHGEYMINLVNGKSLKLSRGYKQRLDQIINQYK